MTASKFKVGNRVYAPYRGYGTITQILRDKCVYPIIVKWGDSDTQYSEDESSFTEDGDLIAFKKIDELRITVVEDKEESEMANDEKFKVGDRVWSPHFGGGIVTEVAKGKDAFPVKVMWVGGITLVPDYDEFTKDGKFDLSGANPDLGIYSVEPDRANKVIPDLINELTKKPEEDEGVVDRMEDALSKKVDDAINPSHYKVKGLPEAHEIITHLMHREQYEGFLWGNIIKYAYRYGRKGNKAETAGKIEWYAKKLKELEEEKRK